MFSLIRSLTLRYLAQRWDRSLLVALSIALGVATLVSARQLNQYVEAAAFDSTVPADVADLYISNGEIGVDWTVSEEVRRARVPGIQRAQPFVLERVTLPEIDGKSAVVFGTELNASPSAARNQEKLRVAFTIVGNPLAAANGRPIAISRRLYEERKRRGRTDTDPVQIQFTNRREQFQLIAVLDVAKDSPIAPFAETLVAMNLEQAARLIRRPAAGGDSPGRVSRVDIFLDGSRPAADVQDDLARLLNGRANVRTPEDNRKSTEEVIGGIKIVLNLCSLGALIVGLFLVYNALSVTVAERRHDIGVMRSVGATRGQIARLFATEAIILGLIGAILGVPLGELLADFALDQFGEELTAVFLNSDNPRPALTPATVVLAMLAGMLTALFAALVPSLQAAADEPADAVRRAPSTAARGVRIAHRTACVVLVFGGAIVFVLRKELPSRIGSMFGLALVLTGLFLAMPIFVALLARLVLPMCRAMFGVEARLAADNLVRSSGRTGVVIGALAAGVSLMFQTAGVGKSNEVPVREWLDQVIRADAFVFRGNLATANSSMAPMEPGLRRELANLPDVERVVGLRFYRPEYNGTFILVLAIDAQDYHRGVRARLPEGLPKLDLFEKLPDGNYTVVSENFAAKWKKKVGDEVTIPGPRGPVTLTIVGIGQDYSWSQGTIFIDRARYTEMFDDPVADAYHVFFKPGVNQEATFDRVRDFCAENDMLVQSRDSVRLYLAGVVDRLFRVAYLQQIIVAVVAALGVVTALLISVLQRRRELGLLRAVGATRGQILKTVLAEATLMGVIGTVLGFALGLPMEWYLLDVVLREESGFVFEMLIPWKEALGIGLVSVVTATLAGLVPALHAMRLNIPEAIAYE